MRENRSENWKEIERIVERGSGEIILLGGDFNARTENDGGNIEEGHTGRRSKDAIKNREGEELVKCIRKLGMHIVNGDTNTDKEGEWTYVGIAGRSTIDYLITDTEGRRIIEDMEIGNSEDSDHQPMEITMRFKMDEKEKEKGTRTNWSEEGIRKFKGKLAEKEVASRWVELKEKVLKSTTTENIRLGKGEKREEWWDKSCHDKKMELRELLRECKRGTKNVKEYTKRKKEYREWIKNKKKEWNKKIIKEIERDKSVKNFWKVVNENENRNQVISDKIKKEEWLKFLKEQLKGVDIEEEDVEKNREDCEREMGRKRN